MIHQSVYDVNKKNVFKHKFIQLNNDEKFRYAISSGTGQKDSVVRRFSEFKRIIEETIEPNPCLRMS